MMKTERDTVLKEAKIAGVTSVGAFQLLCEYAERLESDVAAERRRNVERTEQCEATQRKAGDWQARYIGLANEVRALAASVKVSP